MRGSMYVCLSGGDLVQLMWSSPIAIHFLPNTVTFFFMAEENYIINAYHLSLDHSSSVVYPSWLRNFADVNSADKHECVRISGIYYASYFKHSVVL